MFPLRQESVEVGAEQRLLFLNCEKFQTARNLETMRRHERTDLLHPRLALASNVLTIRQHSSTRVQARFLIMWRFFMLFGSVVDPYPEGKNDPQIKL
jgi:hypothetical protein